MHQNRSNQLQQQNLMQEWENGMGDIRMIKGGCLEAPLKGKKGRRRRSRSQRHRQRSRGLPERRGGRNNKYRANKCNTLHDKTISSARGVLTRHYMLPAKGNNIRECFPEVWHFRTDETEGKISMFAMLGACDRRTDRVFGFVSSFWATFMYKTFSSELRIIYYDFP